MRQKWIQNTLPELHLSLGYIYSFRSRLVFAYHEVLGRVQVQLHASEDKSEMWWVLRDAHPSKKIALNAISGWLPLSRLPDRPSELAVWQEGTVM